MAAQTKPIQANQQLLLLEQKMQNLLTKVRINEQNILNETRHTQLINRNLLEFKTDIVDKVDQLLRQMNEQQKMIGNLVNTIKELEEQVSNAPAREDLEELRSLANYKSTVDSEITKENAGDVLDDVLEKLEGNKK